MEFYKGNLDKQLLLLISLNGKAISDFNHTIDLWIEELDRYNFDQLCIKPSPKSWSLGQVYMHLVYDTTYYLEQINICISTNENSTEEASPEAKAMFLNNEFPDAVLEGAPTNFLIPQPGSKQELENSFRNLKDKINKIWMLISTSRFKGKSKHPGLNYFNAYEWFQFAEMHFRHHLRQKKRIDEFLKHML